MSSRVERAAARARELARAPWQPAKPAATPADRYFAIGDPQAPLEAVLEVLERNDLLGPDGWLVPNVHLVSIGDHFDWGGSQERPRAAEDGLAVLSWLAAHAPDRVTLIFGNHDAGRVGELAGFDDETFDAVHAAAVLAYRGGDPDPELERALCERHPALPTSEVAARDFAAFRVAQRELVAALLGARRFRLAWLAPGDVVVSHAGVTRRELDAVGLPASEHDDPRAVVEALERHFEARLDAWEGEPLDIPELHRPGDWVRGEGVGMLYHRPAKPDDDAVVDAADAGMSRRFDPRSLPLGITQVVGHVADAKCRELLGDWVRDDASNPGEVRHLLTDGRSVAYRSGLPPTPEHATMIFIDGQMNRTPRDAYRLLDFARVKPRRR